MIRKSVLIVTMAILTVGALPAGAQDAAEIVRATIDNWRGESSYGEMTMTIHRPALGAHHVDAGVDPGLEEIPGAGHRAEEGRRQRHPDGSTTTCGPTRPRSIGSSRCRRR